MNKSSTGLVTRARMALDVLRKGIPFGGGWGHGGSWLISDEFARATSISIARFTGSAIDYASEVGDLSMSSLVMTPVNWLSNVLPEPRLTVVETDAEGNEIEAVGHALPQLWARPNAFYTGATMWDAFALSWLANGNCYFLKVRNGTGAPSELWWVPPFTLYPVWPTGTSETFISYYDYQVDGKRYRYEIEDVLHFRNKLDPTNPRLGMSPMASVLREIYGDEQWANYSALLSRNSGVPPFLLSPKGINSVGLEDRDRRSISEEFDKRRSGDNRGRSIVMPVGMDAVRLGLNPNELDLRTLRHMAELRICAVLGIPAEVLGFSAGKEQSTYNNVSEARESAYEQFLLPLLCKIEETLTLQLLPDFYPRRVVPPGVRVKFNTTQMRALQPDMDALYRRNVDAFRFGVLTRKEAKANLSQPFDKQRDDVYISDLSPYGLVAQNGEKEKAAEQAPLNGGARKRREFKAGKKKPLIDDDDLDEAEEVWTRDAPARFRNLLAATMAVSVAAGFFRWNASKRRYEDSNGRAITMRDVAMTFDKVLAMAKTRITQSVGIGGELNVAEWFNAMKSEIKVTQTIANALARGGIQRVNVERVSEKIAAQYDYLNAFKVEAPDMTIAAVAARSEMYVDAAYVEYHGEIVERERAAGTRRVRWVLDPAADHCDGCAASEGEYDIEDVPEIGENECLGRCRCEIVPVEAEGESA